MKRKISTTFFVLMLSIVCVFGTFFLTACSNLNNKDKGSISEPDISSGSNSGNDDMDNNNSGDAAGGTHKHSFSEWEVKLEETCTTDGYRERVCEECDEKETKAIPAGHIIYNGVCLRCSQPQTAVATGLVWLDSADNLVGVKTTMLMSLGSSTASAIYIPAMRFGRKVDISDSLPFSFYANSVSKGEDNPAANIRSITIEKDVKVPQGVFTGCNNLEYVAFSTDDIKYTIGDYFCEYIVGSMNNRDETKLDGLIPLSQNVPEKSGQEILSISSCMAPASLKMLALNNGTINAGMFANMKTLTRIDLPEVLSFSGNSSSNTVTQIGRYAFWNCSSITELTLPSNTTKIQFNAFDGCSALETISIPDTVTDFGQNIFKGCIALKEIKFNGTQAQWNNIIKGSGWNSSIKGCKVTFVDQTSISL